MTTNSVSFQAPTQTTPDIYANYQKTPAGSNAEGSFFQWRIAITVAGSCRCRFEGETLVFTRGWLTVSRPHIHTALRVNRNESGRLRSDNNNDGSWHVIHAVFHPRPHWLPWLDALEYPHGIARTVLTGEAFDEMETAMRNVADAYESGALLRDELSMAMLEIALIRLHAHTARREMAIDPRIGAAVEFIRAHFGEPISLDEIAQSAQLSVPHFSALFTAAVGASPMRFVEQIRLARGAEMLRFGAMPVAEISQTVGYSEPSYFSYRFRLQFGQTPRSYRAASRPAQPPM